MATKEIRTLKQAVQILCGEYLLQHPQETVDDLRKFEINQRGVICYDMEEFLSQITPEVLRGKEKEAYDILKSRGGKVPYVHSV